MATSDTPTTTVADGPVAVQIHDHNQEQVLVVVDGPGIYAAIAIDRPPQLAALKTTLAGDVATRVEAEVRDRLEAASKYGHLTQDGDQR